MTDKLKPCPFCGQSELHMEKSLDVIYCENCGAEMDMERGDWNTRPIEDALQSQLAARDALIERLVEVGSDMPDKRWYSICREWQAMKAGEG